MGQLLNLANGRLLSLLKLRYILVRQAPREAVWHIVKGFLQDPERFQTQAERREAVKGYTKVSLERTLADRQKQLEQNLGAEHEAFRIRTRGKVSDEVYERESALLRAEQTWLREEIERHKTELADMDKLATAAEAVQALRPRLEGKLENASVADREFIYQTLGVKLLAFEDGTFDVELGIPMPEIQTVINSPGAVPRGE